MTTRSLWTLALLLAGTLGAAGCSSAGGGTSADGPPVGKTPDPDASASCPSWSGQVESIVATYCLPCHGPGGIEYPQYDLSTYAQVHARASEVLTQVNAGNMPPSNAPAALPAADAHTLLAWLECGAPDN